jgi:hypothetical protein
VEAEGKPVRRARVDAAIRDEGTLCSLYKTEADQSQRARMQAEQTVTGRSRLRRDLRAFCLAPLPRSRPDLIGKRRQIEAAIGMWVDGGRRLVKISA